MKQDLNFANLQKDLSNGKTTCVEILRNHLDHIRKYAHLNAFLTVYEEEALLRAREIDTRIKQGTAGRLAGLVVGLKDVLCHQYHPVQAASQILNGFQSLYHATAVERLLAEDALIIGRQNCDEFGMGSSNENSSFGNTLNALDETRVPGGSSGGSAVAVMTDMCRISLGSDTGGSVRQPASFCGVIGLKPTYSRISRHGLVAYASSFDCIGIIGRHIEDIATVLQVIAGHDEMDSTSSAQPVPPYNNLPEEYPAKFRIACLREASESPALQPEIRKAMQKAIDYLKAEGHSVEQVDFPLSDYLLPTYYILATAEASSNLSRYDGIRYGQRSDHATNLETLYKKTRAQGFGKEVQRRILLGTFVLSASYYDAYYTKAQKVRRLIRNKVQEIFSNYDFILMPTTPTTAFRIGEHTSNPTEMYLADLFSVQANVAGIPAISLPCGKDENELPIGIQVMANDFEEGKLFQISKVLMKLDQSVVV